MKVLVVANSAGGVGKSTSAHCISVAASEYGKKVLAIDADPSAGLTFACGIENPRVSTKEFLSGQFSLDASTIKSGERFSIIASSSRLLALDIDEEKVPRNVAQLDKYFIDIKDQLSASDDAKRAALFIALPPLPPLLRFGTPIAPLWGGITSIAAASLPKWAKSLYGWPTLPGQDVATNIALRSLRSALLLVPESLRQTPEMKFAFAQVGAEK